MIVAKLAGYDVGYAAGLYAGSQTISASMGLATDAINRLGLAPDQTKATLDAMPIAYAVTYIFGTVGSAILLAQIGPKLLGIDLVSACKAYEARTAARRRWAAPGRPGIAGSFARFVFQTERPCRRIDGGAGRVAGARRPHLRPAHPARADRLRTQRQTPCCRQATSSRSRVRAKSWLKCSAGRLRRSRMRSCSTCRSRASTSTSRARPWTARRLAELAVLPGARGVFLRRIVRGATATDHPDPARTRRSNAATS